MLNAVYITGVGAISPQKTWGDESFSSFQPTDHSGITMHCIEPDYSSYIDSKVLRRMSRILKMGTTAGIMALREAGVAKPDGIITGTGYGCLEDTGSFLSKMVAQNESMLNPTPFIQSTHNSIGSQLALLLGCYGYNQTYTQEGFSFESSLLDAQMSLDENPDQCILTGSADEITGASHEIQKRFNIYRKFSASSLNLFNSGNKGTLHGEGAFYLALSGNKRANSRTKIISVATIKNPDKGKIETQIAKFLQSNSLNAYDLDLILSGDSGDVHSDEVLTIGLKGLHRESPVAHFKQLCGEFPTASTFAVWLGDQIIRSQYMPEIMGIKRNGAIRNVLIFNSWFRSYCSFILLKAC